MKNNSLQQKNVLVQYRETSLDHINYFVFTRIVLNISNLFFLFFLMKCSNYIQK